MEMKFKQLLILLLFIGLLRGESLFLHWKSLWTLSIKEPVKEEVFTSGWNGSGFGVDFSVRNEKMGYFISWAKSGLRTETYIFSSLPDLLKSDMICFGIDYFLLNPEEYLVSLFVSFGGTLTYWRWKEMVEADVRLEERKKSVFLYKSKFSFYPFLSSGVSIYLSPKVSFRVRGLFLPIRKSDKEAEPFPINSSFAGVDFGLEVKL